jgi:hypothetical protein
METRTAAALAARLKPDGGVTPVSVDDWRALQRYTPGEDAAERTPPAERLPAARWQTAAGLPARDPGAQASQIDLSSHYNALLTQNWHGGVAENDLSSLPRGLQTFDGVRFDVRGIIQLSSTALEELGPHYPRQVRGIRIGRKLRQLHALHASGFANASGAHVGSLVLHYADGHTWEIPLVWGEDILDWWFSPTPKLSRGTVAWKGTNGASRAAPGDIALYHGAWENPRPDVEIESIDYRSAMTTTAPFLVALSVQ